MPTTLVDDNTQFPTPISVPASGEPRTAASVQSPIQQLANRTANTKARIDAITSNNLTGGVRQLQRVANASSLTSITSLADGDLCLVDSVGLFEYVFASALSIVTNVIVAANGGVGRWILVATGYYLLNAPNGVAQADASGRTPAASTRNGLIHDKAATASLNATGGTIVSISLPGLIVGDLIKFNGSVLMSVSSGHTASTQVNIDDPSTGSSAVDGGSNVNVAGPTTGVRAPVNGWFSVVNNGTHVCKMLGTTDGTACNFQFASLNVTVTRP